MTREEFDAILLAEGVLNAECRDEAWRHGPYTAEDIPAIRMAAQVGVALFPQSRYE